MLIPLSILLGYQFATSKLYRHGLPLGAAEFAKSQRVIEHASLVAMGIVGASFAGGCILPGLLLAPIVWSRKQIALGALFSGLAALSITLGWVNLGMQVSGNLPISLHSQLWLLSTIEVTLFVGGGVSILALGAADYWKRRDAASLFLVVWVYGTFIFAAFLNWTVNARSLLPLLPAVGILLARRIEGLLAKDPYNVLTQVTAALMFCGMIALWVAKADAGLANSARAAASSIVEKTRNTSGALWFEAHWGFQCYMQTLGARPVDFNRPDFR